MPYTVADIFNKTETPKRVKIGIGMEFTYNPGSNVYMLVSVNSDMVNLVVCRKKHKDRGFRFGESITIEDCHNLTKKECKLLFTYFDNWTIADTGQPLADVFKLDEYRPDKVAIGDCFQGVMSKRLYQICSYYSDKDVRLVDMTGGTFFVFEVPKNRPSLTIDECEKLFLGGLENYVPIPNPLEGE